MIIILTFASIPLLLCRMMLIRSVAQGCLKEMREDHLLICFLTIVGRNVSSSVCMK